MTLHKVYKYEDSSAQLLKGEKGSWESMKRRCSSTTFKHAKYYSLKGITVCPEWQQSFEAFLKDMGVRPKGKTLDRLDNSLGYFPGNCRWATPLQQAANRGDLLERSITEINMIAALEGFTKRNAPGPGRIGRRNGPAIRFISPRMIQPTGPEPDPATALMDLG